MTKPTMSRYEMTLKIIDELKTTQEADKIREVLEAVNGFKRLFELIDTRCSNEAVKRLYDLVVMSERASDEEHEALEEEFGQ